MELTKRSREWIFLLPLLLQWIVFCKVWHQLPERIATHFTIDNKGAWVANGHMTPLEMMLFMLPVYAIVYLSLSLPKKWMGQNPPVRLLWLVKGFTLLFLAGLSIMLLLNGINGENTVPTGNNSILIGLLIAINAFIFFIFRYSMGGEGSRPLTTNYYRIIWALTHLLVTYIMLLPLLKLSGIPMGSPDVERFLLAIFAIMGNITYNIKPNYFIGIRNPWTLSNEMVWKRTHRLSGILLFLFGLAGFILTFFTSRIYHSTILMVVLAVGLGIPFIYAYFLHKRIYTTK